MLRKVRKFLPKPLSRLYKDEDGVAAIEFAIIAPLMIVMYFGLAEMATAISVDRRISHGANVAADLLTQNATQTAAGVEESLVAAVRVMGVQNVEDITFEIQSYALDDTGAMISEGFVELNAGQSALPPLDLSTLDDRILSDSSGVVITRVAYTYTPFQLQFFDTDITLSETFFLKPRRSVSVVLAEAEGKVLNCTGTAFDNITCG